MPASFERLGWRDLLASPLGLTKSVTRGLELTIPEMTVLSCSEFIASTVIVRESIGGIDESSGTVSIAL